MMSGHCVASGPVLSHEQRFGSLTIESVALRNSFAVIAPSRESSDAKWLYICESHRELTWLNGAILPKIRCQRVFLANFRHFISKK